MEPSVMEAIESNEVRSLDAGIPMRPVLVINTQGDDDDELLFSPDSECDSVTPSLGTPPTPEKRHIVWSRNEVDKPEDHKTERVVEPLGTFDAFIDPSKSASPHLTVVAEEDVAVRRSSPVNTIVEDQGNEDRVSMMSNTTTASVTSSSPSVTQLDSLSMQRQSLKLNAKLQSVKEKQRDALSRFQMKGGLVGWLHGENDTEPPTDPTAPAIGNDKSIETVAPRKRGSSLFGNLYDKMKRQQEQLELKLQQFDQPTGATAAELEPARITRPTQPRLSLPAQVPSQSRGDEDHIGFGDFVSSGQQHRPRVIRRDSRIRSASSSEGYPLNPPVAAAKSRLRSLSFATRSSRTDALPSTTTPSALQLDAFPMEECLADPKLAAEFMNVALPGDEWLLTLLYSIEEYEALTTASSSATSGESSPTLETQITMALTIIDRFLVDAVAQKAYATLGTFGADLRATVAQYQRPMLSPTSAAVVSTVPPTNCLPTTLFDDVYAFVFNKLRDAYDTKFRLTREYTQLLSHRQQDQMAMTDEKTLQHLVLTFDQVIESEWCCTVFWVFLFRTSHHHCLSFIMDVKFKLRRLYAATQQTPPGSPLSTASSRHVQHEILLICRRYLTGKNAAISLPITSGMLTRLRDELCLDAMTLEEQSEPSLALMQCMIDKLDAMRTQTRADFKRISFERFASFLTSAMYRDFIVQPGSASSATTTRADDLMQLLRLNRIPFHQPPVSLPDSGSLGCLCDTDDDTIADRVIATVFAFRGKLDHASYDRSRFDRHYLVVSSQETTDSVESLAKTVDNFLLPECCSKTNSFAYASKLPALCFNFLAGAGDASVYGAVWRFPIDDSKAPADGSGDAEKNVHGVCVLSRLPLIDGLRTYLRGFASQLDGTPLCFADEPVEALGDALARARDALTTHCKAAASVAKSSSMACVDTSLQDLFECLSITHIIRLFSLVLQEKKIVLVASSYSVLLCVGESLRAIIRPLLWSHIYVPVLPLGMKGYLHCPTPFIFGLHTSYVRQCDLPKATDDLAIVNLDRDSITGGGDVGLPPLRTSALRDRLVSLCKPRLLTRDQIDCASHTSSASSPFPSKELRIVFQEELEEILRHLETFAFRFECADRTISVVDTSNKSRQWPADAARFYSAVLQSQAFSSFLGRPTSE